MPTRNFYQRSLRALSGELSTVVFRLLVTVIVAKYAIFESRLKEIWRLPDTFTEKVVELKSSIDKQLSTFKSNAYLELVSKNDLVHDLALWEGQRTALQNMVSSHDQRIANMEKSLDVIKLSVDKIYAVIVKPTTAN